jgi:phosphoglycolate phosphatase
MYYESEKIIKTMNTVIFDLDGTISDPAEGITNSINHALAELGFQAYPKKELLRYIGPHLHDTFSELTGIQDQSFVAEAIKFYRERYMQFGYKENQLYDGIIEVLSELVSAGSRLCIATSKRKDIAEKVLIFLKIEHFFTQVHGCDLHQSKTQLLQNILSDPVLGKQPVIMIGDRDTDFLAAAGVNMPSLAVTWGYGEEQELAKATKTVETPEDLLKAIPEQAQLAR